MSSMLRLYRQAAVIAVVEQFQYRVANYLYMIGMIAEPVIYLVVWSTVALAQGGSVGGYTPSQLAAYYIVWTLVRNMNIVLTPYDWERRIRQGQLSGELLRPIHPLHIDLAYFCGFKLVVVAMWVPIAVFLAWVFHPSSDLTLWGAGIFLVAIWGGFLLRFFLLWGLGLLSFWTTRVGAFFEMYFTTELIFSGRLVPMSLLPDWAQRVAALLPFQWAFGFPIEVLIGQRTVQGSLFGLVMQTIWILVGIAIVSLLWPVATRKYCAVGN